MEFGSLGGHSTQKESGEPGPRSSSTGHVWGEVTHSRWGPSESDSLDRVLFFFFLFPFSPFASSLLNCLREVKAI